MWKMIKGGYCLIDFSDDEDDNDPLPAVLSNQLDFPPLPSINDIANALNLPCVEEETTQEPNIGNNELRQLLGINNKVKNLVGAIHSDLKQVKTQNSLDLKFSQLKTASNVRYAWK